LTDQFVVEHTKSTMEQGIAKGEGKQIPGQNWMFGSILKT